MKQKYVEKWEKTRAKGKPRFVLLHGVLGFGLPLFVYLVVTGIESGAQGVPWLRLLYTSVVSAGAGCLWGTLFWNTTEKDYRKTKGKCE